MKLTFYGEDKFPYWIYTEAIPHMDREAAF